MHKTRNVLAFLFLFFLVLSISKAEVINFEQDFESQTDYYFGAGTFTGQPLVNNLTSMSTYPYFNFNFSTAIYWARHQSPVRFTNSTFTADGSNNALFFFSPSSGYFTQAAADFVIEGCEDGCYLNPNTRISFDIACGTAMGGLTTYSYSWFGFGNYGQMSSILPSAANVSSYAYYKSGSSTFSNANCVIPICGSWNTYRHINYTIEEMIALDNDCADTFDYAVPFTTYRHTFAQYPTSTSNIYFDNLKIENLNTEIVSNNLPNINQFSISTIDCINQSKTDTLAIINFDVNVSDYENDDIYYSIRTTETDLYYFLAFDNAVESVSCVPFSFFGLFDLFSLCEETLIPTYNWLTRGIFNFAYLGDISIAIDDYPSLIVLNNSVTPSFSYQSNNEAWLVNTLSYQNNNVDMMYIYPFTDKNKEIVIDLKQQGYLKNATMMFNLYPTIYSMQPLDNRYNFTLYDSVYINGKVLDFSFVYSNSNNTLHIYENNTFLGNYTYTTSEIINEMLYLPIYISINENKYNLSIAYNTDEKFNFYGNITENVVIRHIGMSGEGLYIESGIVGGVLLNPDWTLEQPDNIQTNRYGNQKITLFVTDDYHIDSGLFNYQTAEVMIPYCSEEPYTDISQGTITDTNFNLIGAIKTILGNPFKDYLNAIGHYETGKMIVIYLFIFLLFAFFIGFFLQFHRLFFSFSFMLSSMISAMFGYLLDYTALFISFLILFALSVAVFLAGMFGSKEQHE